MENLFNNPGLSHIGEMIFEELDHKSLETGSIVCHGWKNMLENPRILLKICIKRETNTALKDAVNDQWTKLIAKTEIKSKTTKLLKKMESKGLYKTYF